MQLGVLCAFFAMAFAAVQFRSEARMAGAFAINRLDAIFSLLESLGRKQYGEEAVSQLQHALQAASLAEAEGASSTLITAALFHDIGHITDPEFEAAMARNEERWHEDVGADFLSDLFGANVTDPVRMHVPAKRYLCAVDGDYFAKLSPASVKSLAMQGGAFERDEARTFISQPHASEAIKLRRWDDRAKDPDLATADLSHFRSYAIAALKR
jgi:phosphonate degradation associated HDIG domain protein